MKAEGGPSPIYRGEDEENAEVAGASMLGGGLVEHGGFGVPKVGGPLTEGFNAVEEADEKGDGVGWQ